MRRIKEDFLDIVESVVTLKGKRVLEIGSGNGMRSVDLAQRCCELIGIDPDPINVERVSRRRIPNAIFVEGRAENLDFPSAIFDVVVFTLSFHHVPTMFMSKAIKEAVRVLKPDGHIVFLEPGIEGSFFDAEITFDACDGDERAVKQIAQRAMMTHAAIELVGEYPDETIFQFESFFDFEVAMTPKRNLDILEVFLKEHSYRLTAERRINIFKPRR